jgi:hypothetical protein
MNSPAGTSSRVMLTSPSVRSFVTISSPLVSSMDTDPVETFWASSVVLVTVIANVTFPTVLLSISTVVFVGILLTLNDVSSLTSSYLSG